MASGDATPYPVKNQAYRITFPILDADGDLVTGAAGLDSEISKDAGAMADCTNEATEIAASSGMYYLDLTATEMNADTVTLIIKTSTAGAKTTPIVLYPASVTRGLAGTALPAAAADAAGGVPVSDAGGLDLDTKLANTNEITVARMGALTDWINGGRLDLILDIIAADVVNIDGATIDSDRFLMVNTTIATLASQTSFTLTAGSADDDAYNNCTIVIEDSATSAQKAIGLISNYTGATKTITLRYDPGIFTMAATDKVYILADNSLKALTANKQLNITAFGNTGIDWGNVENPATAVDLSATDIQLCDTTTVNSDMRGTDNAATAAALTTHDGKLDTVDTVVDGIQTDLDNATDGLGALKALIDTIDTVVDAIKAVTDNLPDSGALTTIGTDTARLTAVRAAILTDWIDGGRLDLLLDAIKAVTDVIPNSGALTDIDTGVNNLETRVPDTISLANINSEVDDVLSTDATTELASIPTTTSDLRKMVQFIFEYFRNKRTVTATTETLFKEDASTSLGTSTISDDGTTFTHGELS